MALGKTTISSVREKTATIKQLITTDLNDCHNTYQYVSNNLGNWADETTIGKELQNNMIDLSKALRELLDRTTDLGNKIEKFADTQESINS